MNDDALLYSKHSDLHKTDVSYVLAKYSKLLKWRKGDHILDVGAGEGTVSLEILLPKIPVGFQKLVLLDVSEKMLKFAAERSQNEKIGFLLLDISSTIPKLWHEKFDHIFSFSCLQWITGEERQAKAWKNLFDFLKPGGDILLTMIASAATYDFYENMAKMEKWAPFMRNLKDVVSPYHHLENPEEKLKKHLENSGFSVAVCESVQRSSVHQSVSEYVQWGLSVNPFIKSIPANEHANFVEEYKRQIFKHEKIFVEKDVNGGENVRQLYKILVACASKPL